MKQISIFIFIALLLFSCTEQQKGSQPSSMQQQEYFRNSTKNKLTDSIVNSNIDEPFQIAKIEELEFTAGGGKEISEHKKCDSTGLGFYGAYFLVDRDYSNQIGTPVGGTITIHSKNKMAYWKSTDTDQIIWEIHLESDIISVWDSVKIGMDRTEVEQFGQANKGLCMDKEKNYYSCDFNNFLVDFIFKNDNLNELTITRKCDKE